MAGYLLDSGIVIRHLRGHKEIVQLLRGLGKTGRMAISAVTRLEIHAGMHEEERHDTQRFLSRLLTYPIDEEIADRAGDYLYEYRRQGITLSIPDVIIATTAILHRLTLVTSNTKHFPMPGVSLHPFSK